jgi:hypothetical protein
MTHLDAEVLPDEGEEGGGEVNPPLPVQGHVHPDKLLVGKPGDKRLVILKGVSNENGGGGGGVRKMANVRYWSRTVVMYFFSNLTTILESTYFCFRSLQPN